MSKESLDYQKLCSNYYSSWEEGCCMESCEFYNHNECPVVYVNGLLEERDKTIADLEAKLAESQHENQEFISKYRYWRGECAELNKQLSEKDTKLHEYIRCALEDYNDNTKEIIELKQQLAEKDEEIATLEVMLAENKNDIKELQEFKVGDDEYDLTDKDARFSLQCNLLNNEQDKISFAVEQLNETYRLLHEKATSITGTGVNAVRLYTIHEVFESQIEELKKEILDGETFNNTRKT